MINYRVDALGEMLAQLREGGVEAIQGPESHENGTFAWILDPDGNKVELWEPKAWSEKSEPRLMFEPPRRVQPSHPAVEVRP